MEYYSSSRAQVEGSRRESFKVTSTGSVDCARDDGNTPLLHYSIAF
jgi:hypothetical protein